MRDKENPTLAIDTTVDRLGLLEDRAGRKSYCVLSKGRKPTAGFPSASSGLE